MWFVYVRFHNSNDNMNNKEQNIPKDINWSSLHHFHPHPQQHSYQKHHWRKCGRGFEYMHQVDVHKICVQKYAIMAVDSRFR